MSSLENVKKFKDLSFSQWQALGTKCGGLENVKAILMDVKTVVVEDVPPKLFDNNGRRIPLQTLRNPVRDPDHSFYLIQPKEIDYLIRIVQIEKYFGQQLYISANIFKSRSEKLIKQLREDKRLCKLLNGVYLPICLPLFDTADFDYGRVLEKRFLAAVAHAYCDSFRDRGREFFNHCEVKLEGKVSIIDDSNHTQLIVKMIRAKSDKDLIVAIYFPGPLQGFSVIASREQMKTFSGRLLLAGGFDTCTAMVMYPDVLGRDTYAPLLDMAAISFGPGRSFYFAVTANSRALIFKDKGDLEFASTPSSAGLLYIGKPEEDS